MILESSILLSLQGETDCPQEFDASSCDDIQRKDCYDTSVEGNCCNACSHWKYDISGCEYGDRRSDCQNISRKSCYETDIQNDCCFTCYYLYNDRYQGCEGDTSDRCSYTYSDCYNRSFEKACCETCYEVYNEHLIRDTDCIYGDKGRNCNYLSGRECYNDTKYQECCYHCYNDVRNNEMPNCLYGNKDSCDSIEPRDCYDTNIRDNCCETCNSWMNVHAANCLYGDSRPDCMLGECTAYSTEDKQQCCQTCKTLWPLSTTPSPYNTGLSSNIQTVSTSTMMSSTRQSNYDSTQMPNRTTQNQNLNSNAQTATGNSVVPAAVGGAIGGFVAVVLLLAVVYILWRRGYCTKSSPASVSEGKYSVGRTAADYMNNLGNQSSKKEAHLGQQENVYDYINPDDVNASSVISGPTVQYQYAGNQVGESYDNPQYARSHSEEMQLPQDNGGYLILQRDDNDSSHAYYSINK
ncbi:hypothetical protein ACJMK2_040347 [Sinanodonta woodiana]|uniref:TNFR-Cys domain-containing protein n=1 Tax=Sinanodonta woodiana TaxID=1069815 RepID=A0ABD3WEP8_SINWO